MATPDQLAVKIDKSGWGPGPWQNEPDRVEFKHAGLDCLIVRVATHGALCGYVAVPPDHPWYEKPYDEINGVDVHGGLTYADHCHGNVCHVPAPGEPDNVWWLGFDHAHAGDYSPARASRSLDPMGFLGLISSFGLNDYTNESDDDVYRDVDYVTGQCKLLAEQIANAK
jgi:hypothetical protein